MKIYRNPDTVLPCPLEGAQNVLPAGAGQEGFASPYINSPPGNRQSNPIETCACNFGKILFNLDGRRKKGRTKGALRREGR